MQAGLHIIVVVGVFLYGLVVAVVMKVFFVNDEHRWLLPAIVAVSVAYVGISNERSFGSVVAHFGGSVLFGIGWIWFISRNMFVFRRPGVLKMCMFFSFVLPLYFELLIL